MIKIGICDDEKIDRSEIRDICIRIAKERSEKICIYEYSTAKDFLLDNKKEDILIPDIEMQEMSGDGTLYSYVTFQKAFHPSVQDKVPYTVGVVELEGGVRIISNIVDCEPEQLACNKKVKMKWMDCEEYTKPVFELVEEA